MTYRLLERSRTALAQADTGLPARFAAASYAAFRSGLTRNPIQAVSPLSMGGLPTGRFGLSMAELCINK